MKASNCLISRRDELSDAGNIELEIVDETGRRLLTVPFFRGGRGGKRR